VSPKNSELPRPEHELKAFKKVSLKPGESKQVQLVLDEQALMYYNDVKNDWVKDKGEYEMQVGGSSRNIQLRGSLIVR
jgi:beta-glucosidase